MAAEGVRQLIIEQEMKEIDELQPKLQIKLVKEEAALRQKHQHQIQSLIKRI